MNNTILPARGNLIYVQSEEQIYYYDGSSWQPISSNISSGGNDWELSGNSIDSNNFIGTTNKQDFRIRSNDTLRMIVKEDGKVGINNTNPIGKFQITTSYPSDYDLANYSNMTHYVRPEDHQFAYIERMFDGVTNFGQNNFAFTFHGLDPVIDETFYIFFNEATVINRYEITSTTVNGPRNFTLSGNNGGVNSPFVLLDSRTDVEDWSDMTATGSFSFSNETTYKYYRFDVSAVYGSSQNGVVIYEFDMFGKGNSEFILTTSGDLGIGTDAPTEKLHVIGNILASGTITPDYVFEHYFDSKSELNPNYKFLTLEKSIEYA